MRNTRHDVKKYPGRESNPQRPDSKSGGSASWPTRALWGGGGRKAPVMACSSCDHVLDIDGVVTAGVKRLGSNICLDSTLRAVADCHPLFLCPQCAASSHSLYLTTGLAHAFWRGMVGACVCGLSPSTSGVEGPG